MTSPNCYILGGMLLDPYQFQEVTISNIVHEAPEAVSITLTVPAGYHFVSGQHAVVRVSVNGTKLTRQYSFSSAPSSKELRLTIVKTPGGAVSSWFIDRAKVGDVVEISKPFTGPLVQKNPRDKICMIAGGSGIAPLMSILRENRLQPHPFPVQLLYTTRSTRRCFAEELARSAVHETIVVHISDTARFSPDVLKDTMDGCTMVYVCGSRHFVKYIQDWCKKARPSIIVYSEAFTL